MGTKTLLFTLLAIGFATCTHAQKNNTDTSGRAYGFRYYRLPGMPDSATFFNKWMDTAYRKARLVAIRIDDSTAVLVDKDYPPVKPEKPAPFNPVVMDSGFYKWGMEQYYFDQKNTRPTKNWLGTAGNKSVAPYPVPCANITL